MLVEVAAIISCCTGNQVLARLGGDEFALLRRIAPRPTPRWPRRRIIGAIGSMACWQGELFREGLQ